jgi:hypothetical protein
MTIRLFNGAAVAVRIVFVPGLFRMAKFPSAPGGDDLVRMAASRGRVPIPVKYTCKPVELKESSMNACSRQTFRLLTLTVISAAWLANGIAHGQQATHSSVNTTTKFSIPQSVQYCKQLHIVTNSAKDGFKSISSGIAIPPKIVLPDMWCSILPSPSYYTRRVSRGAVLNRNSRSYSEYSCNVFSDKSDTDASIEFQAYADPTFECLGQGWIRSEVKDRPSVAGKEISIIGAPGEPVTQIMTSIKENGTDMFIAIYPSP